MVITYKGLEGSGKPRKLANIDDLNWCAAVENIHSIKNPFVRNLIQEAKTSIPDFFKKCPLFGVISMLNFAIPQKIVTLLPMGTYIAKTVMFDDIKLGQTKLVMMMNFSIVNI